MFPTLPQDPRGAGKVSFAFGAGLWYNPAC